MRLWTLIPAGGSGTRLWPASRKNWPKFLLPLPGPSSMLQATWQRLAPLTTPEQTFVITGKAHVQAVREQLPMLPPDHVITEPEPRGTGPAIGLGAFLIARHDSTAIMGSFAADHYVADPATFAKAVRAAIAAAEQGYLTTIGIPPRYPETGYGYIHLGEPLFEQNGLRVFRGRGFKEKPDLATARAFVESGEYVWNASMFLWRVDIFLEHLRALLPEVAETLAQITAVWDTPEREAVLAELWPRLPDVTIDTGIMERAEAIAVVPAEFGWADIGDWHGLAQLLAEHDGANITVNCEHVGVDTHATLMYGRKRLVVTLGIENLIIVDTDDVLLVCDRSRAQEVRAIVQELKRQGRTDIL